MQTKTTKKKNQKLQKQVYLTYKNEFSSTVVGSDFPHNAADAVTPVTDLLSLQCTVQHLMQYQRTL
jgi:hypothetical protein